MPEDLAGRVAVVTGAASGIGAALADALAARGAALALLDVAEGPLAEVAARTGGLAIRCDLSDDAQVVAAASRVSERLGPPDLVFANAGVASVGPALEAPIADAEWVLDVNVLGAIRTTRAFAPAMVARGDGAICFTASIAGLIGAPGMPVYSASKHALIGFAESLRVELAGTGVGVTVVCPGRVHTGLHAATRYHHEGFARFLDRAPERFGLTADEVARRAIRATLRGRPQIVLGVERAAVWLKRAAPSVYVRGASALARVMGLV